MASLVPWHDALREFGLNQTATPWSSSLPDRVIQDRRRALAAEDENLAGLVRQNALQRWRGLPGDSSKL
jgi:hypothetical protein